MGYNTDDITISPGALSRTRMTIFLLGKPREPSTMISSLSSPNGHCASRPRVRRAGDATGRDGRCCRSSAELPRSRSSAQCGRSAAACRSHLTSGRFPNPGQARDEADLMQWLERGRESGRERVEVRCSSEICDETCLRTSQPSACALLPCSSTHWVGVEQAVSHAGVHNSTMTPLSSGCLSTKGIKLLG